MMEDEKLIGIYTSLFACYGELHWWPAKTPYEVIVGAVLTQNTAWGNVEKALANFNGELSPERIVKMETTELAEIIRPAGFFNQKAVYVKAVTEWFSRYGYDVSAIRKEPLRKIRSELLAVKGVGRETADSILLYAFDFPTFVVDAYTVRLCSRYPIIAGKEYETIKGYFEQHLSPSAEIYNNFHALIVANAKRHCRKKPICADCPLEPRCEKAGIGSTDLS